MERKPSDISTKGRLGGTFGKFECESQGVWLLKVLVAKGDEWRAVSAQEINEFFFPWWKPWKRVFAKPENYFTHLLEYEFAEEVGEPDWLGRRSLQFTERALECMRLSGWNTADHVPMTPEERWWKLLHV